MSWKSGEKKEKPNQEDVWIKEIFKPSSDKCGLAVQFCAFFCLNDFCSDVAIVTS